jgi:hypothetical protein
MTESKLKLLEMVMNLEPPTAEELAEFKTNRRDRTFYHTAKAKAAIRAAKTGKPLSQEHRTAISEGKYLYVPDEYHREAISEGMKHYWAKRKAEAAKRAARVAFYKAEKAGRVVSQTSPGYQESPRPPSLCRMKD